MAAGCAVVEKVMLANPFANERAAEPGATPVAAPPATATTPGALLANVTNGEMSTGPTCDAPSAVRRANAATRALS